MMKSQPTMARIFTWLTYLACIFGLASLGRAAAVMVGGEVNIWVGLDWWQTAARIGMMLLMWVAILFLPIMIAGWMAYLSRTVFMLAIAPALLMAWVITWIYGFGLMLWHIVRSARPHGMSLNYELSLLGVFFLWPATIVCLIVWTFAKRRLLRRTANEQSRKSTSERSPEFDQ